MYKDASATTAGVTLTVSGSFSETQNRDAGVSVVPQCNSVDEDEQTPTCDTTSTDCALTGLDKPGCKYTFRVRMKCDASDSDAVYSSELTLDQCIG